MSKEEREVQSFDKVVLRGYGELFIKQGEAGSLEIEVDEEFSDRVKTSVDNGKLKIDVVGEWLDRITTFFSRGYESQRIKYYLTVKELTELNISGAAKAQVDGINTEELLIRLGGAADVKVDNLEAKHLEVELPGAGNIQVNGKAETLEVNLGGAGAFSGRQLESQSAEVSITGVGKAIVNAVEELEIRLTGVGSVEYYGKPRVTQNVSGLGHVTSKG